MKKIQKAIRTLLCICLLAAVVSGTVVGAYAADNTTNLPAGILIGDQDGVRVDKHGYYYIDARKLKPGDVIHKVLVIENLSHNDTTPEGKTPYTLTMSAEPLFSKGPVDLLDKVHLSLRLDGTEIYNGPCRGNGTPNMIETALDLGVYKVGDRHELDITLTVDSALEITQEKSEADFKWHFYAVRKDVDAGEIDKPKTGEAYYYVYLVLLVASTALFGLLLLIRKKQKEGNQTQNNK